MPNSLNGTPGRVSGPLLGSIVAIVVFTITALVVADVLGHNGTAVTIIGFVGPTVVALLALARAETAQRSIDGTVKTVQENSDRIETLENGK